MRIVQITPGSGDTFYCENCLRDKALARAWRAMGADALLVPLYLPLLTDAAGLVDRRALFFGGINVYLQQKLGLFRRTPRWLDRLWDSRRLLRWAARRADMTTASDLGRTTVSMLRGPDGRQAKELDRLADWLAREGQPDVVVLSNALLTGLAGEIRRRTGAAVVCQFQDEDEFLDSLGPPHAEQAWSLLRSNLAHVDALVSVSAWYAELMARRLAPDRPMEVVYAGVDEAAYAPAPAPPEVPTVGFLSRMCRDKGLDLLAEAFLRLRARPGLDRLRLRIGGGQLGADKRYVADILARLRRAGAAEEVEVVDDLNHPGRRRLLEGLSILSVPQRRGEACGLYVLEALACGVPVVQPANGVFPELIDATGGGVLFPPGDVDALTDALADLLGDPRRAWQMGQAGRRAVVERFSARASAERWLQLAQR
ncbi:MAG: glycosyltransferase family 4 protein, partial [Planctomycetes bacterium]|nr:glycosyltransferase family 4 protein [Planctomycetota bacterium]